MDKYSYLHHSASLVETIESNTQAKELFAHSPNLLWLMCIQKDLQLWEEDFFADLFYLKQQDILKQLFPIEYEQCPNISLKQQLKLLNKVTIENAKVQDYRKIKHLLFNPRLINEFKHWKKIPIIIIHNALVFPNFIGTKLLKISITSSGFTMNTECSKTNGYIKDIKMMAEILKINNIEHNLKPLSTHEAVEKMHDKLTLKMNKTSLSVKGNINFKISPLDGTHCNISQIKNDQELRLEGQLMHHCVYGYLNYAIKGNSIFFRVNKPERATLELNENYQIRQFTLHSNRLPSEQSWKQIREWLDSQKTNNNR